MLVLTADPVKTCAILDQPDTHWQFPDVLSAFIPNVDPLNSTCFTGAIEGMLNGQPVTGISYSGQITNSFPDRTGFGQLAFAAATTLVLKNQANQLLGRLYFRDTGLINLSDGMASEQLAAIAGTGLFWGIKGMVTIMGNEFLGGADHRPLLSISYRPVETQRRALPTAAYRARGATIALVLLGAVLAGCSDPGDAIPPALTGLHQRAAGGDAAAQMDLGLHYVTGTGIAPDEQAALRWIGKAAAQGNAAAQFELGSYYTLEPHRDFERAAERLRQSALQGFAPAQSSLAILYWAGKGVPQDRVEAYAWLGLAAEQGEREALDRQPGLQAELSAAELQQAWQRAQHYRQGPL
jgi:hypothetical protein